MAARKPKAIPEPQPTLGLSIRALIPREPPITGLGWGLHLHRYVQPADWPRELERQVPAELRQEAEAYLRNIAACMREQRRIQREGFKPTRR